MLVKHYDLVHAEDGTGASDLSGEVGAQLQRLRVVEDGARQGHAQRVVPPWGAERGQRSRSATAAHTALYSPFQL